MKKVLTILSVVILTSSLMAQQFNYDWKNMKPDQRKEVIQKMKPEDRMKLLNEFREKMMISELDVSAKNQDEFKTL